MKKIAKAEFVRLLSNNKSALIYAGLKRLAIETYFEKAKELKPIADRTAIAKDFGGGTIFEAQGIYKHDDGKIVFEKTLRIEILFAEEPQIKALVAELKKIFNQESIAVQVEDINSDLW